MADFDVHEAAPSDYPSFGLVETSKWGLRTRLLTRARQACLAQWPQHCRHFRQRLYTQYSRLFVVYVAEIFEQKDGKPWLTANPAAFFSMFGESAGSSSQPDLFTLLITCHVCL